MILNYRCMEKIINEYGMVVEAGQKEVGQRTVGNRVERQSIIAQRVPEHRGNQPNMHDHGERPPRENTEKAKDA